MKIKRKFRPIEASNPVQPSRLAQLRKGSELFADFTGHESRYIDEIPKPTIPDVLVKIGHIDGVMYTTRRDGKTEKYIHKFKSIARPIFAVSEDGRMIFLIGGRYQFTERGIIDKS